MQTVEYFEEMMILKGRLIVKTSAIICKVIKTNSYRYLSKSFQFYCIKSTLFFSPTTECYMYVIVQCDVQWWTVYTESINKRQEGIKRIRENKQES